MIPSGGCGIIDTLPNLMPGELQSRRPLLAELHCPGAGVQRPPGNYQTIMSWRYTETKMNVTKGCKTS